MPDRVVRFERSFFDDLDRQLPAERSSVGQPSATDFLLHDVPRLRDRLAEDFEGNTLPVEGHRPIRVLIAAGSLVSSIALYAYVDRSDTVAVIALDVEPFPTGQDERD